MHFTVLSAMPLPQDIPAAKDGIPVEDVTDFIMRKLYLANLSSQKPMPVPELSPADIDQERWECLMEIMVGNLLAPYNQNTTDIAYMAFDDQTDEGRRAYEQSGTDCVKTPDGRIIPCVDYEFNRRYELHDGKVYRQDFGRLHHRKQTKKAKKYMPLPNYPFQKFYATFDEFMVNHWGCERQEGTDRYGYYFNPNGEWDWWQIGGRWPFRFLVKNDCDSAVTGEPSYLFKEKPQRDAPDGYRWVAGARKCDIAWDVMRKMIRDECTKQFLQYEEWFNAGQVPTEHAGRITLAKDGIASWGDYLYRKGETLEHRIHSLGLSDQHPYPIGTFAYVDADGWNDQGWGTSDSNEDEVQAWYKAVADFIEKQPDDALLVSVDCHT